MLAKIVEYSAKNRALVLLVTAALCLMAYVLMGKMPLDAIPDLSDTQVIIYSKWDKSPDIIEDQVTYPIVTALLGSPKVKTVRGISDYGYSYVYVIFEDGTDIYWARSRVLENLNRITSQLPEGVRTELGPDATSVGWIYQYALVDQSGKLNSAELRSIQDFQLKFALQSVPGVAEVASLGGFSKQYQVQIDPNRLSAYGLTLSDITKAVKEGNASGSARVLEISGREYMLRANGYVKSLEDIRNITVSAEPKSGIPILIKNVATVSVGPDMRRGVTDLNGMGDTPGAVIVMRHGENVLRVIEGIKAKLAELQNSLPSGVKIVTTYDRSNLVHNAIDTLKHELKIEILIVCLVILIFLWHFPSAIVPILTIPISVLLAFIPMYFMGVTANIMSLAGIALSIGVLVDGAIVEVENAYNKIEEWHRTGRVGDFFTIRLKALQEVTPSVCFSLLVIAVSFLPVFALVDQEGRLFGPLAISKTLTMLIAAILAITLDPAMRMLFSKVHEFSFAKSKLGLYLQKFANILIVGRYVQEHDHPITRRLMRFYEPAVRYVLRRPLATVAAAVLLVCATIWPFSKLGSEFMPPLQEGDFLYMPTAFPGMSITEATRVIRLQGEIISEFPEVKSVHAKAGRADTSTDPAPLSMVETVVQLKPMEDWPAVERWYSKLPQITYPLFNWALPRHRTFEELQVALNQALQIPGMPNIWTMPIRNRIDMLSTGIRTPLGIKIMGASLSDIQSISEKVEGLIKTVPGVRNAFAERLNDGFYIDFDLKRDALSRYGLSIDWALAALSTAVGGESVSTTIEGRERYPINVRFARDFRDNLEALKGLLIETPSKARITLAQIAEIHISKGPAMLRNENGLLAGFIYIDTDTSDLGGVIQHANQLFESTLKLPSGYSLIWSGQYENMLRSNKRMLYLLPVTLLLVTFLLYLNTHSIVKTAIVLLAVPFSLVGSVWLLYLLGYNLSIAVGVGMIALMGLDAETGVFMLMYLDMAYARRSSEGSLRSREDLKEAIVDGAAKRLRPKLMTVLAAMFGLLPILFSAGIGSDLMRRIAAPMVGGLATSFLLELLVYPALYYIWKARALEAPGV